MGQDLENKLMQTILRQVEKVEYFCTAENISPNQAVHELRKLFKRLRSLLRFYEPAPGNNVKNICEEIRHFGKLLSPLRESYVNAFLFENEIRGRKRIPERKMKVAAEKFFNQNKTLVGNSLGEHTFCKEIRQFFNGFESQLTVAGSLEVSRVNIACEMSRSYQKSFFLFRTLPDDASSEALHALRKKLKRLYFQLDFIRLMHPKYFKLKSEQLSIINDQLGNDHDFHVFSEALLSGSYGFDDEERTILKNQVKHLHEMNRLKCRPRLKQFFSESPKAFDQRTELLFQR
jgi:CHAD domain-containing protein